jgi:methylated-DNA-protein-cysteine methyltransferase-like protein
MKARRDILETILRIPRGKVASYSQVAFAAGWPGRARLVARVLGDVPPEFGPIPWFRVINAQGRIAIPQTSPGHNKQIRLLKAEGVVFLNGKVSFAAHGWKLGDESPLLD